MLHVWLYEYNACGPFAGVDADVSPLAPPEPNHGACDLVDVVPCVLTGMFNDDGTPMCAAGDGGGGMHDGH